MLLPPFSPLQPQLKLMPLPLLPSCLLASFLLLLLLFFNGVGMRPNEQDQPQTSESMLSNLTAEFCLSDILFLTS